MDKLRIEYLKDIPEGTQIVADDARPSAGYKEPYELPFDTMLREECIKHNCHFVRLT